jgi:tetratricopeptide (TPR) repeat protein
MATDARGSELTGATADQATEFDAIVMEWADYKLSAFPRLKALCSAAPTFVMAQIFKGYFLMSMGVAATVPAAIASGKFAQENAGQMSEQEALHLDALNAWANGDVMCACTIWDRITLAHPRDLIALKFQHFALFWRGESQRMRDAAARALPNWQDDTAGFSHVMGMHAFGLEETGDYIQALKIGRQAVEIRPDDLWSVHAVAHVYEMQNDIKAGIQWLNQPISSWQDCNPFKQHLWWHTAMFALDKGDYARTLDLYDAAVWPEESAFYLDVQNAASLLARLESYGADVGDRWQTLSVVCHERQGEHILMFTEPHYTMAFGATGQDAEIKTQKISLAKHAKAGVPSNRAVVEAITLPICNALQSYYKGEFADVVDQLLPMRYDYQPIGGSHAQRDVFNYYLIDAAIASKQLTLAKSLLAERVALRTNSVGSWNKYAHVSEMSGDVTMAKHARGQVARIAAEV